MNPSGGQSQPTIVLAVTVDLSLGLIEEFALHLRSLGWDVHVVSSPGPRSDRLRSAGLIVHAVSMSREPSPFRDLTSLINWVRLLARVRPGIVMSGTPKAGLLGMAAAWFLRVPDRVYVLRGLRLETVEGIWRYVLVAMEKLAFGLSTRAVAVGPSLRDEAVRLALTKAEKVSVIGMGSSNGVNPEQFRPRDRGSAEVRMLRASLGLSSDMPTVGFVGRLSKDKGLDTLMAATNILEARGIALQLLLVGGQDGSDVFDSRRAGSRMKIISAGQVADTSDYYAQMDLLCLPTRREGFPNVVLEAAASGVPTVTTNATGAKDSVVDEVTGLIVDVDDATSLARALERLINDSSLRSKMGQAARQWAIENFSRATVWARTIEFLLAEQSALPRKHPSGKAISE